MFTSRQVWFVKLRSALVFSAFLLLAACASPEERAQTHYEQGVEFFDKGNFAKAKIEFKNALQLNGKLVPAWFALAKVDEQKRDWAAVIRSLVNITELDQKHVPANLKLGNIYLFGGRIPDALKYSDAAFALAPENADVLVLRAAVLFKLNDEKRAIETAKKALKIEPKSVGAIVVLAADRMKSGDAEGALEYLQTGIALNERDIGLQLFKLRALETLKDDEKVESVFRKLIEFYPNTISFQQALAQYYVRKGETDKAEKEIREIAAKNPENFQAGINVVRFVASTKGADAAEAELEKFIAKGGDNFGYRVALSQLYVSRSQPDKALSLLRKIVEQEASTKNEFPAKLRLSRLLLTLKKTEEADKLINDVLAKDATNVDALLLRATVQIDDKKLDEAITVLRAALNEQPRSIPALLLLSRAHELNGSIELADERLAVAAKTAKYGPNVGLQYSQFLIRRGFLERAEDVLDEILSRKPGNLSALTSLAQVKLQRQDWLGAEEISETIRKTGGDKNISDQILGAALGGQQKFDASIKVLQEAYEQTSNAVQPMVSLIRAFVRGGKIKEAEDFLLQVLKTDPDKAEARILLANVQLATKRVKEAESSFKMAVSSQSTFASGYRALSEFYLRQNRIAEANDVLQQGLAKLPESFILRLSLAGLLERTSKIDAAISEYETLIAQRPGSTVVSNNLASLYAENRDDEKSIDRAFLLARQFRNSRVPHFKDTLGWTYFKRGEYRPAITLLQEAADGLPEIAVVRYHLGMSYLKNKQNEEAARELKKALELAKGQEFLQREEILKVLEELKVSVAN